MKAIFMGTPEFAVPVLERLCARHDVAAVYTRPDAASGRGKTLLPPPVKLAAERLGIPVRQPATLRDDSTVGLIEGDAPDVIVVAAYGLILPPRVLSVPRHGCVNVHASLLPRHRGAAPVQRAILAGDTVTGVSIMRMEAGLDTGPYALQRAIEIGDMDAEQLTRRLSEIGADALLAVLGEIEAGTVVWIEQDDSAATYAAKIVRSDVALDAGLETAEALRRIRASSDQARSRVIIQGVDIALMHAVPSDVSVAPGHARRSPQGLLLGVAGGTLLVDRMRVAGKSPVDGASWARGSRLDGDSAWAPA